MSIQNLGGALGDSLGSSLTVRMSGAGGWWSALPFKPVPSLRIASVFQTMVPTGYTRLQEERLAMVDLGVKPEAGSLQSCYRQETSHTEGRRLLDRASRSSVTLSDCGDGSYAETEPMLVERRLSGEQASEEEEEREEEGLGADVLNMPKESPLAMALQIVVPFLLAGFGTVSAGMVLDIVQVKQSFYSSLNTLKSSGGMVLQAWRSNEHLRPCWFPVEGPLWLCWVYTCNLEVFWAHFCK